MENPDAAKVIAELKAARTAWHETFGVPISAEYARFLQAVGDLTDWAENAGVSAESERDGLRRHYAS